MKHLINSLVGLLSFVFLLSCSSDNEQTTPTQTSSSLSGTKWTAKNWDFSIGDDWVSTHDETFVIYFTSSTEGMAYYGRKDMYSDLGNTSSRHATFFTYDFVNNNIEVNFINGESITDRGWVIKDGVLYINGTEFSKNAISSSDQDWLSSLCGTTGDCRWYSNLKGNILIDGKGRMADYASYSVTPWAKNIRVINSVYINSGVTHIGAHSFASPSIGEIEFGDNYTLQTIGDGAFENSSISKFDTHYWKTVGNSAFAGCSYYRASVSNSAEEIGDYAYSDCKSVNLSFTPKLHRIGDGAMMGADVTSWTNSEVLEYIGGGAVYATFSEINLPNSIKHIGHLAISGKKLNSIHVGSGLQEVVGTPFYPSSSGTFFINKNTPIELERDIIDEEVVKKWTLHVPQGSKYAYSKAAFWKNFKTIVEDNSLVGDGTTPDQDGGQDNNKDNEDDKASGTIAGHEYVDLGLSVKWATCNIGAASKEKYGEYYAWGETSTKKNYTYKTYKWTNDWESKEMVKFSGDWDKYKLTPEYDVAYQKWGSQWRMPTKEEMDELKEKCKWEEVTVNKVRGLKVTGPNGKSIFLPYVGHYYENNAGAGIEQGKGSSGHYWTSTARAINRELSLNAYSLYIVSGAKVEENYRYEGRAVRAVTK